MDSFEKVVTSDGSITFFHKESNEHYHTLTGALEEAELKHLAPTKEYFHEHMVVIDFCFGLGYNTFAALAYASEKKIRNVTLIAFENDLDIMLQLEHIILPEKYERWKKLFLEMLKHNKQYEKETYAYYEIRQEGYTLILYLGDAKECLNYSHKKADILFFDPFSLRKCPDMWSEEIFKKVYLSMSEKSILTTYSCSKVVRKNMSVAGFEIEDGPIVGRKAPGTLALKKIVL